MFDRALLALPGARRAFSLLVICALLDAALGVGLSLAIASVLATLWEGAPLSHVLANGSLAAFAACFAVRRLLGFVRDTKMDEFAARTVHGIRTQLAGSLWDAGPRAVREEGSGATAASLVTGMDDIERYVALALPKTADLMVATVVFVIALFFVDWPSGIVAICTLPFVVVYMRILGSAAKDEAAKRHAEFRVLANHFVDSLRGAETLRLFGALDAKAEEVWQKSERLRESTVGTIAVASRSNLVLDLLATFALAASAILLGFRLISGSVGIFAALATLVLVPETFGPTRRFASDFHATLDGRNALAAVNRLREYAEKAARIGAGTRAGASAGQLAPADGIDRWNEASSLVVDGVRFSYGTGSDASEPFALDDISVRVDGLAKVGIVGVSGAGKSTLANILAGLERPGSGAVRIQQDGRETVLDGLDTAGWLGQVAYISQRPYIFSASLRDNIALFRPQATEAEVREAVRAAGLDDVVANLPQGLLTMVGEGGRDLSGGQAQRVALARAFVDPGRRVLVFDEPTAHLDIETEYDLAKSMGPLMEGRLVFFATHRLHWMRRMDVIWVLKNGRIVENGSFDELVDAGGPFSALVEQLRGDAL